MIQKWILLDLSVSKFNCKSICSDSFPDSLTRGLSSTKSKKKNQFPITSLTDINPCSQKKKHWKACCVYTLQVPVYDSVHAWSHIPYMQILHKVHVA